MICGFDPSRSASREHGINTIVSIEQYIYIYIMCMCVSVCLHAYMHVRTYVCIYVDTYCICSSYAKFTKLELVNLLVAPGPPLILKGRISAGRRGCACVCVCVYICIYIYIYTYILIYILSLARNSQRGIQDAV